METILGFLTGFATIAVLYLGTMLIYFFFKRKYAPTRFAVELCVVGIVLLLSFCVKSTVLICVSEDGTFVNGFSQFMEALYAGVGGLSFEGIPGGAQAVEGVARGTHDFLQVLYSGTAVYSGLVALSVVTARISYEVYSRVVIWLTHFRKANKDVYIFTQVTADSLLLAKSIKATYDADKDAQKNSDCDKVVAHDRRKNCVIIFAGNEMDAFDRKNALHREIMGRGFLFWSYAKGKDKKSDKSLLKRLGLKLENAGYLSDKSDGGKSDGADKGRVHIFALGLGDNKTGAEAANGDIVFDEVKAMTREMYSRELIKKPKQDELGGVSRSRKTKDSAADVVKRTKKSERHGVDTSKSASASVKGTKKTERCIVDMYILTDNDIDYSYYERWLQEEIGAALREIPCAAETLTNIELVDEFKDYFQIHIVSEALMTGHCLADARIAAFESADADTKEAAALDGQQASEESIFVAGNKPNSDNEYRVMVLGFGNNGRQSMNALFTDSAYVDDNGIPSQFIADIYDEKIEEYSGLYAYTHPLARCVDCGDDVKPRTESEEGESEYLRIATIYNSDKSSESVDFSDIAPKMKFPLLYFHKASCNDMRFIEFMDKVSGRTEPTFKGFYNAFVVALGDDEKNLSVANAIIEDFEREAQLGTGVDYDIASQCIYVNLRDEKNYGRLRNECERLKIITYGNREDIYSFGGIVEDEEAMKYHYAYTRISDKNKNNTFPDPLDTLIRSLDAGNENVDYIQNLETIYSGVSEKPTKKFRREWSRVTAFKKESSVALARFRRYYIEYVGALLQDGNLTGSDLIRLAQLEHNRWCRFHIVNGWIYAPSSESAIRAHDCLCPLEKVPEDKRFYDIINVVLAYERVRESLIAADVSTAHSGGVEE